MEELCMIRHKFNEMIDKVISKIHEYYQSYSNLESIGINLTIRKYFLLVEKTNQLRYEKLNKNSFDIKVGFYIDAVYAVKTKEIEIQLLDINTLKILYKYFPPKDLIVHIDNIHIEKILFNDYKHLKSLDVTYDTIKIQSSSELHELPRDITKLDASGISLTNNDLNEIRKLKLLTELNLSNTDITSFEYYGEYLKNLNLSNNEKLCNLKTNHYLHYLDVSNTKINSLENHKRFESMLCDMFSPRTSFSNLDKYIIIEKLGLKNNINYINIAQIKCYIFEYDKTIKGNLTDLKIIGFCPKIECLNLQTLYIKAHNIDIEYLISCKLLTKLNLEKDMYGNSIKNIEKLNEFINLSTISISITLSKKFSFGEFDNLKELSLSNNNCTFSLLKNLSSLESLNISDCNIQPNALDNLEKINKLVLTDITNILDNNLLLKLTGLKIVKLNNVIFNDMTKNYFPIPYMIEHLEYENIYCTDKKDYKNVYYYDEYEDSEDDEDCLEVKNDDCDSYPINIPETVKTLKLTSDKDILYYDTLFEEMNLLETLYVSIHNITKIKSNSIKYLTLDFEHYALFEEIVLDLPNLERLVIIGDVKIYEGFFKKLYNLKNIELSRTTITSENSFKELYLLITLTLTSCIYPENLIPNIMKNNKFIDIRETKQDSE